MTGFRFNLSPLKEPLCFIKLVEWLTAIFAFGSCVNFSAENTVSIFCGDGKNETLPAKFLYPFRLSQVPLINDNGTLCDRVVNATHLVGDSSSSVHFFVGVGVFCFLYCMFASLVYFGYMHIYKNSDLGPILDMVITVVIVFLWLVSSSAWAKGLQNVKDATDTDGIGATIALCKEQNITCQVTEFANVRGLNVSVVFGYLNTIVWALNTWYVYKETRWYSQKNSTQTGPTRHPTAI
ncbi:synaptophysin-like protein 1 [Corythoichthys intestinalis]|uniref:synaptophysin-like protein 1 n=1 Tax=Corythoichthys intestinalis TaxID=161448 RepID=UPI0025A51E41|nr:synaptophysin-like protein 1 [Corythoichthys intestinalis]XP_057710942.1 synaptophysin-like protein 1 [Corythoichthys intestinalis]XP_061809501.1 synaptophysin-like protein 1 [Nerophis lumbriciformis]